MEMLIQGFAQLAIRIVNYAILTLIVPPAFHPIMEVLSIFIKDNVYLTALSILTLTSLVCPA